MKKLIITLLLLPSLCFGMYDNAWGQITVTANPTSDENVSGTWTGTASSRYSVVNDYPDQSGALTHGTTAGVLTFGFTAFSIPTNATSITVAVLYYDAKTASQASTFGARIKVNGTYYNATTHNPANGTVTQRTDSWPTNPNTGAAWTPTQVNSLLTAFGVNSGSDASPTINLYSIRLQVTYYIPGKSLPLNFFD